MSRQPLVALLEMRESIIAAIEETRSYGYESWNERMLKLQADAIELFRQFDHYYSDPDDPIPAPEVAHVIP